MKTPCWHVSKNAKQKVVSIKTSDEITKQREWEEKKHPQLPSLSFSFALPASASADTALNCAGSIPSASRAWYIIFTALFYVHSAKKKKKPWGAQNYFTGAESSAVRREKKTLHIRLQLFSSSNWRENRFFCKVHSLDGEQHGPVFARMAPTWLVGLKWLIWPYKSVTVAHSLPSRNDDDDWRWIIIISFFFTHLKYSSKILAAIKVAVREQNLLK